MTFGKNRMTTAFGFAARAADLARKAGKSDNGRLVGRIVVLAATGLALTNCSHKGSLGVSTSERVVEYGQPVPKGGGVYKVGNPYQIGGKWYYPKEDPNYEGVGTASWYGLDFHGRRTANGEIYDMDSLSAAHPTLPLPTFAKVRNLKNGREVVVRVNDRGPYAQGREIDLSKRAAELLGFQQQGTTQVKVTYLGRAPLNGGDGWVDNGQYAANAPRPAAVPERRISDRPVQVASSAPMSPMPSMPSMRATGALSYIQVGSFRDAVNADRLRQSLAAIGQVDVDPVDVAGTTYFRVRVGPLAGDRAMEALESVRRAGAPGARLVMIQ